MLHRRLSNDIWDKVRFQRCNLIPQGQFALLEPRKLKLIWQTTDVVFTDGTRLSLTSERPEP